MAIKRQMDLAELALVPVYRIDRNRLPRLEIALHRHVRLDRYFAGHVEHREDTGTKVPLWFADNAKADTAAKGGLAGGLEAPVTPVLTGLLLSAYA